MRYGARNCAVTIQQKQTAGKNKVNEKIVTWVNWRADVFAEIIARRGGEKFDAETKQRYSSGTFEFRFLYSDVLGVSAAMRLVFEGQAYNILNLAPDHVKKEEYLIFAELQEGDVA